MSRRPSRRALRRLPAAAVLLAATSPAFAQNTAPATELAPVESTATAWRSWMPVQGFVAPTITTGTKTDTPLIEAPQSVGVVTRDQMQAQAPQTVSQALRFTAGVLPEVRPSNRYDSVFVRGFGGQGTGAAFVNFLDGLRMGRGANYAVPNVDPWLLERIEVLRGPASVLYGQTSSGGIVNLVSRRPTETPVHEVQLNFGSHERMQAAFDFGGPLTGDGTVLYRLTGIGYTGNTQYDYIGEERFAIAPALTWKPTADTTLTILTSYQKDPETGFYNFQPAVGTVLPSPHGQVGSNFFPGDPNWQNDSKTQYAAGYQFEHRFNSTWTVRQNFRYSHIDSNRGVMSIQSLRADGRTANRTVLWALEDADTIAVDNQVQASFATGPLRHTLLGGLDYAYATSWSRVGTVTGATVPGIDIFNPVYGVQVPVPVLGPAQSSSQDVNQTGIYLTDQIALGGFRFNIGIRHDWADTDTTNKGSGVTTSQSDEKTTWRVGALYLFDFGLAPYVTYSTSFLPNTGLSAPQRGRTPFGPTEGEQYEAGVKFQPRGFNSFIQASVYQIKQQNVLTPDPLYNGYSVPTGEIRSRGFELEGRASLDNNLDLILAYAYTDAEVTQSNQSGVQGKQVPQVPKHMVSAWADYRFDEGMGVLNGFGIGAGIRYVGSTYGDSTNTFKVPSATVYDAAIRYDFGAINPQLAGLQAMVNANNLTDKEYIASCSSGTACYFANRRVVTAGLRYVW